MMPRKASQSDYIILFTLGALWGTSFGAIKIALNEVTPFTVMSVRILLACVALLVLALLRKTKFPKGKKNWVKIFWMAILGTIMPFFLVPWGQIQISSSTTAILMAINPIFALFLGHFFSDHEKFTIRQLLAMLISFTGVFIVFGENSLSGPNKNILALSAIIIAGIGYVISGVIATRIKDESADSVSASIFVCASIIVLPFWLILEKPWDINFDEKSIIALTHLGLVSTGIAFLMRYYIIIRAGAVFLSYVAFIIPIFGILFGVVFLGESLSINTLGAIILILFGVYLGKN